jgi:hypothetical protein
VACCPFPFLASHHVQQEPSHGTLMTAQAVKIEKNLETRLEKMEEHCIVAKEESKVLEEGVEATCKPNHDR